MLTEDRRKQLDDIVGRMTQNRETDDAVNFVVNDFKSKYSVQESGKSFAEKTAGALDLFFGGGKVGEAIGTGIAKGTFGKTAQRVIYGKELTTEEESFISPAPSGGELAGSALQSAALFAPLGTIAKGVGLGARALGFSKGVSAISKISAGALAGELFDVSANLQQGKTGKDVLTPGLGTLIGGGIPGAGVVKNVVVRFGERQAPRVINSLIKPLARDFSYGKNPGRAVAEEGIVANNFDDLIVAIRSSRQKIGQEIGTLGDKLSTQPLLNIRYALSPLDDATKVAASQNNPTLLARLNNVKRSITEVLEPTMDDTGNLTITSLGSRDLEGLTFKQVRNILSDVGDLTAFTGNPTDDKLVNFALKQVYGKIKGESLKVAKEINPSFATRFEKLTEKYADLTSAEIATKYRDKIVERQTLIGLNPTTVGVGTALVTAVATGGATIPVILAGVSGALLDKLATTPGFKTRLAYILSKKTQSEATYLFKKVPALSKFFSTKAGLTPGDVLINEGKEFAKKIESIPNKQGGFVKNPLAKAEPLAVEAKKYKSAEEFVKAQDRLDAYGTPRSENGKSLGNPQSGDVYYHGTSKQNKTTLLSKGFDTSLNKKGFAEQPEAFFVGDYTEASMYLEDMVGVRVKDGVTVKTIGREQFTAEQNASFKKGIDEINWAKENGYDAINAGDELIIVNPTKFEIIDSLKEASLMEQVTGKSTPRQKLTKSQLTDIWKANQPLAQEAQKKLFTTPEKTKARGIQLITKAFGDKEAAISHAEQYWAKEGKEGIFHHATKEQSPFGGFEKEKAANMDIGLRRGVSNVNGLYVGRDAKALHEFYNMAAERGENIITYKGNPKLLDLTDEDVMMKFTDKFKTGDQIEKELSKNGYDGIKYFDPYSTGEEIVITNKNVLEAVAFNGKSIKTKSQLSAQFDEAGKGRNPLAQEAPASASLGQKIKQDGIQKPTIQLKRDVQVTTLSGEKAVIDAGEVLKAYESGGKALLKDGREYIVSKSQYENIKNNSLKSEAKEFAPELKEVEETVKSTNWTMKDAANNLGKPKPNNPTKFAAYQLPEGKNYKEILIKAPTAKDAKISYNLEEYDKFPKEVTKVFEKAEDNSGMAVRELEKLGYTVDYEPGSFDINGFYKSTKEAPIFKSSHWDEPNVISHLRLNERTYNGKKVTFMEELQSDWAREARKTEQGETTLPSDMVKTGHPSLKNWQTLSIKRALKDAVDNNSEYFAWINGEQTSARYNLATQVEKADWAMQKFGTGETAKVIKIKPIGKTDEIRINVTNDGTVKGGSYGGREWQGKKLDEVLGKGLADKIMAEEKGTLSGEGLKFGGEWANNLYDKQVGNIVKDLTGAKIEVLDMGLPISKAKDRFFSNPTGRTVSVSQMNEIGANDLKVGKVITTEGQKEFTIIEVLGGGKFKAIPKQYYEPYKKYTLGGENDFLALQPEKHIETFDISTKKTTQQGIRLTEDVKRIIRGEAPKLK